jgi:phage terminase large subunit-like protein
LSIDQAYRQLDSYTPAEQLAYLQLLEDKRKKDFYVKYWSCSEDPKLKIFFDQIAADFRKFTPDIKIFAMLGGNRSSKSERAAFITVAWLLGKEYFKGEPAWRYVEPLPIPEHGCNIWVVGLDFSIVRDVLWGEKLRFGLRHPGLIPNDPEILERISDHEFQVTVKIGERRSTLTCKSADSGREKFQSASIDLLLFDEECEADIFDEAYQRTVDCGGKIVLALTPLTDIASAIRRPWVFELHKKWLEGQKNIVFTSLSVLDNPFVPDIEKEELKRKWAGHPEERARLYGEFVQRSGLVYKVWSRATHLVQRRKIPREWYRIACIDPAPTGPTACAWVAVDPVGNQLIYDCYKRSNLNVSDHAKNILVQNAGEPVDLWLIDPKGGSQRNAETHRTPKDLYNDAGIPCRYANVNEDYGLLESFEYLKATGDTTARHPKVEVFRDLFQFTDEIETYVWDVFMSGANKGFSKDKPRKGNDDILNCWQYVCSQLRGRKPPQRMNPGYNTFSREERERFAVNNSYT